MRRWEKIEQVWLIDPASEIDPTRHLVLCTELDDEVRHYCVDSWSSDGKHRLLQAELFPMAKAWYVETLQNLLEGGLTFHSRVVSLPKLAIDLDTMNQVIGRSELAKSEKIKLIRTKGVWW